jgi:hypothetical protein
MLNQFNNTICIKNSSEEMDSKETQFLNFRSSNYLNFRVEINTKGIDEKILSFIKKFGPVLLKSYINIRYKIDNLDNTLTQRLKIDCVFGHADLKIILNHNEMANKLIYEIIKDGNINCWCLEKLHKLWRKNNWFENFR